MNRWRLLCGVITLGTLCACAAQQGSNITPARETASSQVVSLRCAEMTGSAPVEVRYLAETIYRKGAVLPNEEGLACLEELTLWLKNAPQKRWQITVAGEDGYGFDPLALAGKRQELLQRFFTRKGVALQEWEWQRVVSQDTQLQIISLP